ncbi:catechol 2,3-dioxygenase-like lactoylglutathione lyase family enzyme [Maribacter vaceletii]|uniref:Catechol 2,3-dioxygenase-like lactoylglutathione lyase family enzyme n=1 Tax=Maribacter vaceletii TaxID=1206816 RepID=A0A495EEE9_9FLAO|nr:VOC family protein [Maribacter vaceletii]RKR15252.1 catechol 2,3-dioxygenase-like lactoylglutathione lyase family enzyme [Maribacter vaceletii]
MLKHNLHFKNSDSNLKGFQEVVFSVYNIEKWEAFLKNICGWKVVYKNTADKNLNTLWHLNEDVKIEEILLINPGDTDGFLRLVKFHNVAQEQIRSGAQIWDSGGIFDVNTRVKDMETMYRNFQNEGWNGFTDPHRFTFGKFDVAEVLLKGPDGVTIAIMQRFYPPLEGFEFEKTSRFFNSTTICKNYKKTLSFFTDILGFKFYFESPGDKRENGNNVIGIPPNINGGITAPVCVIHPEGKNFGSIELLETKELKGKDCSHLAKPPNLGILMLRFPVKDAETYAKKIVEKGGELNTEVQVLEINPYGKIKAFSIRTPDGVWLEFLEIID